jgi:hypothetical protein
MMDPHNPVFDVAQKGRPDGLLDLPDIDIGPGYLTPPTHGAGAAGGITLGVDMSHSSGQKSGGDSVDPDILIQWPVSIMSPMASEDGGSPRWDWDSELNAMND